MPGLSIRSRTHGRIIGLHAIEESCDVKTHELVIARSIPHFAQVRSAALQQARDSVHVSEAQLEMTGRHLYQPLKEFFLKASSLRQMPEPLPRFVRFPPVRMAIQVAAVEVFLAIAPGVRRNRADGGLRVTWAQVAVSQRTCRRVRVPPRNKTIGRKRPRRISRPGELFIKEFIVHRGPAPPKRVRGAFPGLTLDPPPGPILSSLIGRSDIAL